jgi:hypothetical protein
VPQPEEFSVYEAATPVRNVLELRGVLSAAAPPRIDPGLPGAPPPPLTREECENVFREYIELRRFYADRSEAMPFSHFAELLKRQRAQLLREGHPMVRFEVYRGGDGKIAVKGIGRSK